MPEDGSPTVATPHCPNCGKIGYDDAGTIGGDLFQCGNENCSVFKFFHGENDAE